MVVAVGLMTSIGPSIISFFGTGPVKHTTKRGPSGDVTVICLRIPDVVFSKPCTVTHDGGSTLDDVLRSSIVLPSSKVTNARPYSGYDLSSANQFTVNVPARTCLAS